ncbi:MAG: hypothetical protein ACLT16_10515 [[Clostridium] innocuum]
MTETRRPFEAGSRYVLCDCQRTTVISDSISHQGVGMEELVDYVLSEWRQYI